MPKNRNPIGSKGLGDSFEVAMVKSKVRLDRKIDRESKRFDDGGATTVDSPEALEALISCEELN